MTKEDTENMYNIPLTQHTTQTSFFATNHKSSDSRAQTDCTTDSTAQRLGRRSCQYGRLEHDCLKRKQVFFVIFCSKIKLFFVATLHLLNFFCSHYFTEYVEGPADMINKEEVRQAIQDLKVRKAAGPSGVTAEMIKAAGEQAVDWLTSICNRIVKEEAIPESWQMSKLVAIYKGKGDVLECSSSQGIKLLEHGMKVAERVQERRLRQAVEIDKIQFGFRPGTGTTHVIFIARQLQERYREKHRELWWAFVDLEKAF